ncbi:sensor histidine kinase [Modestobacter sp. URMC 112]
MTAGGALAGRRQWLAQHPRLADAGLAALLALLVLPTLVVRSPEFPGEPDGWTVLLLALSAAALVVRRERPLRVWAIGLAAGVAGVLQSDGSIALAAATCVALYTIGSRLPLRTAVLASLLSGACYTLAAVVAEGDWLDDRGVPGVQTVAWSAAAAAIGVAVRSSRAALGAAEARALQAELTREEEAERRVSDERLRIARELHDVLAHHISVVNVQAGVARHLLDADPQQARAALDLVREASRTVLSEMSTVVGLLRTSDEGAPTEPTPGMARVGELVDSIRRAGLDVTWSVSGELDGLAAIEDLTAYRVVQEALTNALRYGTGAATMVLDSRPEGVGIEVRNPVGRDDGHRSGGGHGLIGMRERVDAVGGRLVTGPGPGGSYRVSAFIPRSPA